jgi:glycosyltransferase involved in cell wall biosynthesis
MVDAHIVYGRPDPIGRCPSAMNTSLLADARWTADGPRGVLGIRRLATEILARLPDWTPVPPRLPLLHPLEPLWLAAEVARRRPAVYYSPGFNPPLVSSAPVVFTICDLIHLRVPAESGAAQKAYYRLVVRPAARRARAILTLSEYSKAEIVDWAQVDSSRVHVIGCGVSSAFRPDGERHEPGFPYILYAGNRKPHKNLPRLVRALAESGLGDHRLILTGRPDSALTEEAARHGVEGRLAFAGDVDDGRLAALYRGADAVALPSLYEGFGLTALEAMACGIPVVAADATALPEVTGGAAVLVDPEDPEAIGAGLRYAVENSELGRAGLRRAADFTWDSAAERARVAIGV